MITVTVLGSGTSTGVPTVACTCATCKSTDPRDTRLRTSLLLQSELTTIVIDTSMDFRKQMLDYSVMNIDAILYTHHHFDHIGGFDDIRPYNFRANKNMPVYALRRTIDSLRQTFPYAFDEPEQLGGGVPMIDVIEIDHEPFVIGDITIQPIPLLHGSLRVNGYRIGSFAYCTDTNAIPPTSMELLAGVEVLILDGLRPQPHPTHFTVDEAVVVASELRPRITYLTHIAHQIKHDVVEATLPDHVRLAFDGLQITL
ncbi:MBL fold metallo-hydrolase [soil metagenome]